MNDNFEKLLEEYKDISNKLNKDDINLDEAIKLYEESNKIYTKLNDILNDAKVKIKNIREKNV